MSCTLCLENDYLKYDSLFWLSKIDLMFDAFIVRYLAIIQIVNKVSFVFFLPGKNVYMN